jgi:hypothetical protein
MQLILGVHGLRGCRTKRVCAYADSVLRVHASAGKLPIASTGLTIRVGKGGCGKATWLP